MKEFIVVYEIYAIKIGDLNRFLIEGANQKGKKKTILLKSIFTFIL